MKAFFLAALLCFATPLEARNWKGFLPIEELDGVVAQYATQGVVQVYAPSVGETEEFEIVRIPGNAKPTKVHDIFSIDTKADRRALRNITIETCRRQHLKFCPVTDKAAPGAGRSTAFFTDGNRLNGCRHSFHNWLSAAAIANNVPVETLSPPMVILDYKRKVLYNSATVADEALIKISVINTDVRLNGLRYIDPDPDEPPKPTKFLIALPSTSQVELQYPDAISKADLERIALVLSDFVQFETRLPVTLRPQTTYSWKDVHLWREVYSPGYPGAVYYFDETKIDSIGNDKLVVSRGKILKKNGLTLDIEADGQKGQSGSPFIDSYGRIYGVHCFGKSPDKFVGHTIAIVPNIELLEQAWSQLKYK